MSSDIKDYIVTLEQARETKWDVLVLGAGVGGCTAAYRLASKGLKVLVVEKGKADFTNVPDTGIEIETVDPVERINKGWWPNKLTTVVDGRSSEIWAPLGCGVGGSSLLYAAALGRLEPMDFLPQRLDDKRTISWPFSYQELEPYYEQAERLYSVRGTLDPLSSQSPWPLEDPLPINELDSHFFDLFREAGLNPYRLHVGVKKIAGCNGCGGRLCTRNCKQSAIQSCILPILDQGFISILEETEALSYEASKITVTALNVLNNGKQVALKADKYILAAGAYFSPVILKKSKSTYWPNGLGNNHDLVGRNLMFHVSEHIAIWPRRGSYDCSGARNTIALRDFYFIDGKKYGEFQSTGVIAGFGNILYFLRTKLDQSWLRHVPLARQLLRIPAFIGSWIYSDATVFACILEDFPYHNNRIVPDTQTPSGIRVEYNISEELKSRVKNFRKLLRSRLKNVRMYPMSEDIGLNFGHPCGTCLAGNTPETSVVNQDCRLHGLDNLFITDSSFMPTSGGVNPSLTIAANALRVADKMTS